MPGREPEAPRFREGGRSCGRRRLSWSEPRAGRRDRRTIATPRAASIGGGPLATSVVSRADLDVPERFAGLEVYRAAHGREHDRERQHDGPDERHGDEREWELEGEVKAD